MRQSILTRGGVAWTDFPARKPNAEPHEARDNVLSGSWNMSYCYQKNLQEDERIIRANVPTLITPFSWLPTKYLNQIKVHLAAIIYKKKKKTKINQNLWVTLTEKTTKGFLASIGLQCCTNRTLLGARGTLCFLRSICLIGSRLLWLLFQNRNCLFFLPGVFLSKRK